MTTAVPDTFLDADALRDPDAYFSRLREEDPVHWSAWLRSWVVTRYDDVGELLRSNGTLSADTVGPVRQRLDPARLAARRMTFEALSSWLPFTDDPLHARLRSAVNRSFTPRRVAALRPRIESLAADVLDDLEGQGTVEVVEGYSRRLTVGMIASLLGIPPEDHATVIPAVHGIQSLIHSALGSRDRQAEAEAGFRALVPYFEGMVADRRADPRDDLITAMAVTGNAGAELSTSEIAATCILLIFAGQETTTSLVASSLLALLRHPRQLGLVRRDPGLIPSAVEEALRYWGVAWSVTRIATRDIMLRDRAIARDDRILLVLGTANRDPRKFDRPDEFDIQRDRGAHIAFGSSIHFCLGAPLARLEDEVALRAFLERFPAAELDPDHEVLWLPQLITRQLESLYLRT